MGKRPNLNALDKYFNKGNDFALTDDQYEKLTGIPLPKKTYYIINKSALAKKCQQEGFKISVQEKKVIIKKVV